MSTRWQDRLLIILALALATTAKVAAAQTVFYPDPRQAALTLGNRAADAIARGEHTQAEELLRQAYEYYPAPTIAVLHARTLVHLQRLTAAASAYERAALTTLTPDSPDVFQRAVEQAKRELAELRPRIPRLQVVARGRARQFPKLRLRLDGQLLPATQHGRWILVDPGRRVLRADLGDVAAEQVVQVAEQQSVVVEVLSEPRSASTFEKVAIGGSLALGAAGISTGIIGGIVATSAHSRAQEQCPGDRCVEGSTGAQELERFRTYRVVSTLGYVIGVAGLSVGGYFLIRGWTEGPALRVELDQHTVLLSWESVL